MPDGDCHRQGSRTVQPHHFSALEVESLDAGDRIFHDLVVLGRATKPDLEGGGGGIAVDANVVCVHVFQNTTRERLF